MKTAPAPSDVIKATEKVLLPVENSTCDACGSRAFYFATVSGTVLAYCGHHATKYEVKLLAKSTKIVDLRYMITP